ncbi:Heavy metal-associated isoprenylated plant protein 41, partial [Linum grandiflorum]
MYTVTCYFVDPDGKEELMKKYKNAESNIEKLKELGAQVFHEVDATRMRLFRDLSMRKFDRIVFNFPHAGFHGPEESPSMIREHSKLVQGFFRNAAGMLRPNGEVHVSHKTTKPYCYWNLEELALGCSLALRESVKFNKKDYPWYNNKRGDGKKSDQPFNLGECKTFKFTFTRYSEFTRMAMNLHPNNGIPPRRYKLRGDGIVPEAAAFSRTMVPPPRNLNQHYSRAEDQRALRSLWLLLIS